MSLSYKTSFKSPQEVWNWERQTRLNTFGWEGDFEQRRFACDGPWLGEADEAVELQRTSGQHLLPGADYQTRPGFPRSFSKQAAKHVLRHHKGTRDVGLTYWGLQEHNWLASQRLTTQEARATARVWLVTASTMECDNLLVFGKADVRGDLLHRGRAACSQWGHQRSTATCTRDILMSCSHLWRWSRGITVAARPNAVRLDWLLRETCFKLRGNASNWNFWP